MQECAIKFDQVTRTFGNNVALNGVSFEVPKGKVFALLGENGAGKTTSIKSMLGACVPNSGRVSVLGLDPVQQGVQIRKSIGYVAEQPSLYDWMTVKEIGWFAAGFYANGYEAAFARLINGFGLPITQKLKTMSKGQRAKVVLALAMAHNPSLLILDEPTSGLDTLVRREFLESMVDLTAIGQTVFLSSHQIPEVERVADTVAIMKNGNLLLVEELSILKDTCREVIITFEHEPNSPSLPIDFVSRRIQGRQCIGLVRTDDESSFYDLQSRAEIRTVDVRRPSLEDIFVSYIKADSEVSMANTSEVSQEVVR